VGLKFDEVMQGFYKTGTFINLPIRCELSATIEDLNAFLADPRRPVAIAGKVFLALTPDTPLVTYDAVGSLDLLKRVDTLRAMESLFLEWQSQRTTFPNTREAQIGADALLRLLAKHASRFEMDYNLTLQGPGGPFTFTAIKTISGGPGLAAWTQTTTAAVVITHAATGQPFGTGTIHVHLADFLGRQLPSFTVTGTQDDVRIAWAFGRFFRFFFGTLRQVFLPGLEALNPFGDRTS